MPSPVRIAAFTLKIVVLGLVGAWPVAPAYAQGATEPQVIRVDQTNRRQIKEMLPTLPDETVLEFKEKRITAAELRAKMRSSADRVRALIERMTVSQESIARLAQAKLQVRRAPFLREARAKLQAANTKVLAELARVRQIAAMEQEAGELWRRSKNASPEERMRIDERAAQLLKDLEQIQ
jgi:hypothetical protein